MSLESKIMDSLKTAMKAKDEAGLRTLRSIKAAIIIEKTAEGSTGDLTEADELKMLTKLAKQRRDSLDIYKKQSRPDLAKTEEEELAIIEGFLPKQLTADELRDEIKKIIADTGASSPADMGKVMGIASKSLAGRADGRAVSESVKALLAGG